MKEILSEKEAAISRQITNILVQLHPFVRDYIDFLEDQGKSFSYQLIQLRDLRLLINCITVEYSLASLLEVNAESLYKAGTNLELIAKYVDFPIGSGGRLRIEEASETTKIQRWRSYETFRKYYEKIVQRWNEE